MSARCAERKKPVTVLSLIAALSLFFAVWGCTTAYVDTHLVARFKPPIIPNDQETAVYVIRTSSFSGSALSAWVSCNESYVSELADGTHCYFKTPSGLNTISIETLGTPIAWISIDDCPGESVFLKLDCSKGTLERIPRDQGITLVMFYEQARQYKGDAKSDRYETALMNPGLVGLHLMKPLGNSGAQNLQDQATITFIRNQSPVKDMSVGQWGGTSQGSSFNAQADSTIEIPSDKQGMPIGIWSEESWVGNLMEETYIQIQTSPGEHLFFCKGESWSVLQASVQAGQQYVILVEASIGFQHTNIQFVRVEEEAVRKGDVGKWLDAYTRLTKDKSVIDTFVQTRLDAALPLISKVVSMVEVGHLTPVSMTAMERR